MHSSATAPTANVSSRLRRLVQSFTEYFRIRRRLVHSLDWPHRVLRVNLTFCLLLVYPAVDVRTLDEFYTLGSVVVPRSDVSRMPFERSCIDCFRVFIRL